MGSADLAFDSLNGAMFVQPGGPGTTLYYLNCHDSDDIEAAQGDMEVSMIKTPDGQWEVIGSRIGGPEMPTTTVTGLTKRSRDWLEKVVCPNAALYILQSNCGRPDNPMNYIRAKVLHHIHINNKTYSGVAINNAETPEDAKHAMEIQAWPPLLEAVEVTPGRVVTTEAQSLNDLWTDPLGQCGYDCGSAVDPGDLAGIAADSAAGPATANILFSTDGATFAAGATDPFGAGLHAMTLQAFPINKSGRRWLAGRAGGGAVQGLMAYSDDNGATWTTANIGGAAAGHGPSYGGGCWAPSKEFCHVASIAGYLYKSIDGGQTWVAKDAAVITAGAYTQIHFSDDKYGAAVAAAGIVALTTNGGESWYAGTVVTGAPGLNCVRVLDNKRILVGTATGQLWQSVDFGETWTQITGWTGSGAGQVRGIDFAPGSAGYIGWMIHNSAAPLGSVLRTIDGGANWVQIADMPANSGVNAIKAVDANTAWIVGEANAGTGFITKVIES